MLGVSKHIVKLETRYCCTELETRGKTLIFNNTAYLLIVQISPDSTDGLAFDESN